MSKDGIRLLPVYVGGGGGADGFGTIVARSAGESRGCAAPADQGGTAAGLWKASEKTLEAQIEAMRSEFAQERSALFQWRQKQDDQRGARPVARYAGDGEFSRRERDREKSGGRNGRVSDEHGS